MKKATNNKKEEKKMASYIEKEATEDISVRMLTPDKEEKRASASLTIDTSAGKLVVYGNAVNGRNGWFFSYPQYKKKDGGYQNLVFALDKEVNDAIASALEECADEYGFAN